MVNPGHSAPICAIIVAESLQGKPQAIRTFFAALSLLLLIMTPARAQEATPAADASQIAYGVPVSGQLDDDTPNVSYSFEALRGEWVIAIHLSVSSGDLDPFCSTCWTPTPCWRAATTAKAALPLKLRRCTFPPMELATLVIARFGYSVGYPPLANTN
ncbi:MAG: hypothetical protein U0694_18765 [Anaerolineae bacterium]